MTISPSPRACEVVHETLPLEREPAFRQWQQEIPREYWSLDGEELARRIAAAREALGGRALILGHHYQRDDIIRFADLRGDSLKLARWASQRPESDFIVFCGVHFMAESADILASPHQKVILPNMAAGCSLADMAYPGDVQRAWEELEAIGLAEDTIPVTYINSAAALKAFCGERGGIVCTSSNAKRVLTWALDRAKRVLFFPDQHLGRNTGRSLGIELSEMPVWDYMRRRGTLGGNDTETLRRSKLILWSGYCSVHQRFTLAQIDEARQRVPDVKIAVHPECSMDVVEAADFVGSTEAIIRTVEAAEPGTAWGIGTEVTLVTRLARENADKRIFCLDPIVCPCSTMYRVHPAYLAWALESLASGRIVNEVAVDQSIARPARLALDRMLSLS